MGKSNQKTVLVSKETCNKNNLYATINLKALNYAAGQLSGDGFKMWVYFSKNQNGYEMELSSKHAEQTFSLSKRRYDNAIKELIEGGFLVDSNIDQQAVKNSWTFYEFPLDEEENKPLQQNNTRLVNNEDKPSPIIDTRNITENTNNKSEQQVGNPLSWSTMTDKEREDYFREYVF